MENSEENLNADMHVIWQVAQLTGFSDPVYAEAYVNVNQYDIVLDLLIVNQTSDTLQNVTLELATLGKITLLRFRLCSWRYCSRERSRDNERQPPPAPALARFRGFAAHE